MFSSDDDKKVDTNSLSVTQSEYKLGKDQLLDTLFLRIKSSMIPKSQRLNESEVKWVLKKGRPFFSKMLTMKIHPNRHDHHRFGIIVSGKNIHNAVIRNKLRRTIYDLCESELIGHALFGCERADITLQVKIPERGGPKISLSDSEMEHLTNSLNLIKKHSQKVDWKELGRGKR